jgi:hypothetical protein
MTSNIQLISIIVSFLYGQILSYLTLFNYFLLKGINNIIKNIIMFIYVLDMAIIYAIILFKINNGCFHHYFIIMIILSYFVGLIIYKKIISKIVVNVYDTRLKKK